MAMREILFRGKSVNDGNWVIGSLVITTLEPADDTPIKHYHIEDMTIGVFPNEHQSGVSETVASETVGQYTGLIDKNGKKIFEGDLLNGFNYPFYRSGENKHNYFAEVVWFDNGAFGFVTHKYPYSGVRGISEGNADYFEEFNHGDWEIIGNIHDNPELLEAANA